jgi:predicted amidohydrolase YtcJ
MDLMLSMMNDLNSIARRQFPFEQKAGLPFLIEHANLLSFHPGMELGRFDAIAVEGKRILAIGRGEELRGLVPSQASIYDAGGKTLMPGFNDTHIHLWKVGNLRTYMLDLRDSRSLEEMLDSISDYTLKHPELEWITARGFNEAGWKEATLPEAKDLDRVAANKPVYVIRTCAHIGIANSKAMQLAGIDRNTSVPAGGEMRISDTGKPNGIFTETALGLITNNIPPYTRAQLEVMAQAATDELFQNGITSATDPAADPLLLQTYYGMHRSARLRIRLHAMPILLPDGGGRPFPLPELFHGENFNVNTVKFFSDGGLSGKTAALKRPYKGSGEKGMLRLDRDIYLNLCTKAMEQGLGVATHAIGDAAIEMVTAAYCALEAKLPGMIKRIEHLGLPEGKHLELMARNNISTSMQSIFINELGRNFIQSLDKEYLDHCYPLRSVLKNNILLALSSDAPVVSQISPLAGIHAAVTRKTAQGEIIAGNESITVAEALKAYTFDAAVISRANQTGSLQAGKLADFIILDQDPLTTVPEDLPHIKIEQVFVDGVKVSTPQQ